MYQKIRSSYEKEKYDVKALCKFMGKLMFAISFFIGLGIVGEVINKPEIHNYIPYGIIALVIFTLIYCNTNNRFEKKVK